MNIRSVIAIFIIILSLCTPVTVFGQTMEGEGGTVWEWVDVCQSWVPVQTYQGPADVEHGDGNDITGGPTGEEELAGEFEGDNDEGEDEDWLQDYWDQWWEDPWVGWEDDDNLTASIEPLEPVSCPEIKSATFKAPNHTRTTIGIGEEVEVKVRNLCGSTVNWSLTGGGTIMAQGPKKLEFQAGYVASTITLTATLTNINSSCSSCQTSFTIVYDVILPNKIVYERVNTPITNEVGMHVQNYVSGGYFAANYILPDNVNFYKCKIFETDCFPYQNDGDYHDLPPATPDMYHNAAEVPAPMTDQVYPGKGTLCEVNDVIWFQFWCRGQKNPKYSGEYNYQIEQFVQDMSININQSLSSKFDEALQKSKNIGGQEIQIGGQLIPVNSELQIDKHSIQDGPTNINGAIQFMVQDPTSSLLTIPTPPICP